MILFAIAPCNKSNLTDHLEICGEAPVSITINTTANFSCAAGYVWRAEVTGAKPKIGTCKVKGGVAVWATDKPCVGS